MSLQDYEKHHFGRPKMIKHPSHTHTHTVMNVSVPLLLHGDLEAAVQDLVERVDPVLHLCLAVCGQQVGALILHLQLESKPPDLVVLRPQPKRRWEKEKSGGEKANKLFQVSYCRRKSYNQTQTFCH